MSNHNTHGHSHSYAMHKTNLSARLKRIEGQVRGISKMIESDRYCVDILTQIAAVKSALHQVGLTLLDAHTRGCVVDAIVHDNQQEQKIDELMDVFRKFTKA